MVCALENGAGRVLEPDSGAGLGSKFAVKAGVAALALVGPGHVQPEYQACFATLPSGFQNFVLGPHNWGKECSFR